VVALSAGIAALLLLIGIIRPRWLLLTFVFLAPIVPVNVGYSLLGEQGMTISPVRLIAACFIVGLAVKVLLGRVPSGFPLAIPFVLYLAVRFAGLIIAPDKVGGAVLLAGEYGALTAILSYGAYCVIRCRSELNRLMTVALVAAVIAGGIGMWEWETGRYFRATPIVQHYSAVPVIGDTIDWKIPGLKRITGPFQHSLILAGFMCFLIPVGIERARMNRGVHKLVAYAMLAFLVVALVLTFGRAALAVTVLEALAMVKLTRGRRVWPVAVAIAAVAVMMVPIYGSYHTPGEQVSLLVPKTQLTTFVTRYVRLISDFRSDPAGSLVGFGLARSDLSAVASRGERSWRWTGTDSDFERVLGTSGILGFLTWLLLFLYFAACIWRAAKRGRRVVWETPIGAISIGVVGAVMLAIPGVSVLTYPQTLPIVAITMGAALRVLREDQRLTPRVLHSHPSNVCRRLPRRLGIRRTDNRASGHPSTG
jgi:hypothetical protein